MFQGLLFFLIFLIPCSSQATSLVEIRIKSPEELTKLFESGLLIEYSFDEGCYYATIETVDDLETLNRTGLDYEVLITDLDAYYRARLPLRDDIGGYRTYDEIIAELRALSEDFPEIVSRPFSIGQSVENRDIWGVKISDNPNEDEDEPEALFFGNIHADEVMGPEILFAVMHRIVDNYEQEEFETRLVNERQMYFFPTVNPDGLVYEEREFRNGNANFHWRKNRRINEDGSIGVDLNRNFGYEWGYNNYGANPNRGDYRGIAAFSEPEARAIRDFINRHHIRTSISFHSAMNCCLFPFAYDTVNPQEPDLTIFYRLGTRITAGNGYRVLPFYQTGRGGGVCEDWLFASDEHNPIYGFCMEVGHIFNDGHWPARERVPQLIAENILAPLIAADYADEPRRVLPPLPPINLTAEPIHRRRIQIRWEPVDDDINPAITYTIYAGLVNQMMQPLIENIDTTSWIDEERDIIDGYMYQVIAFDAEGDTSEPSRSASITFSDKVQIIPLNEGWNLISASVSPVNESFPQTISALRRAEHLLIAKDEMGRFCVPSLNFNNIPPWNVAKGYFCKLSTPDSLIIIGEPINENQPLPLHRGWNLIAYHPRVELTPDSAFRRIRDVLEIARDGRGRFYIPAQGFSNMGTLKRGYGYQLKLTHAVELIWGHIEDN